MFGNYFRYFFDKFKMTPNITPTENGIPQIVVLDGGFSTQLCCHIGEIVDGDPLWSARFLATHPEEVINTHLDFLRAGADVIMTNTYQASIGGFVQYLNMTPEDSLELIKNAVNLAKTACDQFMEEYPDPDRSRPLIVGSVGPYGASLHDGSEYSGSYADQVTKQQLREWHIPRIEALIESGVDLLGIETIPCGKEAEVLVELIKEYPHIKAWLSFSCKDGAIANGDNFHKTVRKCYDSNPQQLVAVGINCLGPKYVEPLIKGLNKGRENRPIPIIVYPNSGENYNPESGWIDREKCEPVEGYIKHWLDLGVTWIGGCCRTYASDVSRIRNEVQKWSHEQKFNSDFKNNV
ncbi:homocysteine S-methyltransferase YbgG-like [Chrysoperla carnea]|uniref:homocysteine S-methyltransferase YbgG-like n=1 Tax=Chrysoperla carnea TaxID=189513 RepID=UPI001D081C7A|nr:homocysteine S-methyltransferase YbgG-like [Chrysoperla carnea]